MNGIPMSQQLAQAAYEQIRPSLSGDVTAAIERVEQFIAHHPDFAQAHNDLGVLYHRAGNLLHSLAHYEKANRLQPDNPNIRKNLAEFYAVELGWTDDAIVILTDLLKNRPNDTEILSSLAAISIRIDRNSEAETFIARIVSLEPWNIEAKRLLEDLRGRNTPTEPPPPDVPQPQFDAVLKGLRQSISNMTAAQRAPEERYRQAVAYAREEKITEAINELEELVRVSPGYAIAHNDLGVLYYRLGDLDRSVAAHEQAVLLDPGNSAFKINLANLCYTALGKTDEAIRLFVENLRENPKDVETLLALGQISALNNRYEEARVFLGKALELEPWNAAARELLKLVS